MQLTMFNNHKEKTELEEVNALIDDQAHHHYKAVHALDQPERRTNHEVHLEAEAYAVVAWWDDLIDAEKE